MAVSYSMLADPDNFRPGVRCKYQETLIGVLNPGDNYIAEKIWESLNSSEVETLERIVKGEEPELYDGMVITNVDIATLLHLKLLTRTSMKSKLVYVACTAKGYMVWESAVNIKL